MNSPNHRPVSLLLAVSLLLGSSSAAAWLTASFDPATGAIPFPNNLLFAGSSDGTLNIPGESENSLIEALNSLDGFSTTNAIRVQFHDRIAPGWPSNAGGLDADSLIAGDSVRVFEIEQVNPFIGDAGVPFSVRSVVRELEPEVEFVAGLSPSDPQGRSLLIQPTRPLRGSTGYLVVLTNGLRDANTGQPVFPDLAYLLARYAGHTPLIDAQGRSNFAALDDASARGLAQLQPLIRSQESAAYAAGVPAGSIVLSWTFTTQSIDAVPVATRELAQPRPITLDDDGFVVRTSDLVEGLPGIAELHSGTIELPYFLQQPTAQDPAAPLFSRWTNLLGGHPTRYLPTPQQQGTVTIPLLITQPYEQNPPQGGWPVVIFQHGLSRNRGDLVFIADSLASHGIAGVAIDLPLHGVNIEHPLHRPGVERHFELDLFEPYGETDSGLQLFSNFAAPMTIRDNSRQAISDLFNLVASLGAVDVYNDGEPDFDLNRIQLLGHSLGAVYAVPFFALEPSIQSAAFISPAAQVMTMTPFSGDYGPIVDAQLAQFGIEPETADYTAFFQTMQALTDSVDGINYARASDDRAVLVNEVTETSVPGYPADGIVPNRVAGFPLAGTRPLARLMGLEGVDWTVEGDSLRVFVSFNQGAHSSLLEPFSNPATTLEMQQQLAVFFATNGTLLQVTDPDLLNPAIAP